MSIVEHRVDSHLGRWTVHFWTPPRPAGPIEMMWHFDGYTVHPRERVFPNGLLEIIVQLGARYRDVTSSGAYDTPFTCISGVQTNAVVIESPGCPVSVMGIRLRPTTAFALTNLPLSELTASTVDLGDVFHRAANELLERCHEAETAEGRFAVVAEWVSARLARARRADRMVAWTAAMIEETKGAASMADLRNTVGASKTRFASAFRAQVGVTPKVFARIYRFQHLLSMLATERRPGTTLAELALDAGYYDQAHMTAEFRELAGLTPREFVRAEHYVNSTSIVDV